MLRKSVCLSVFLVLVCCALPICAQQAASADSVVPSLVKFTGSLSDIDGKPLSSTVGVTFLLYKEQTGGAPLWMETQNVQADKNGHYSVMLGMATAHGLPADVFVAGEARWLAVQPSGQAERPRTLLLSVPYALKALDAETLGGKPASAFLTAPGSGARSGQAGQLGQTGPLAEQANEIVCSSGTTCKMGFVPLFSSNGGSAKVTDSIMSQSGTNINVAGTARVSSSASAPAFQGTSSGTNAVSDGVDGVTSSASASGVAGVNTANSSGAVGVYGTSAGYGVFGTAGTIGVFGQTSSGYGVWGEADSGGVDGVHGLAHTSHSGVAGINDSTGYGVWGEADGSALDGVHGISSNASGSGVAGVNFNGGDGVFGGTYNGGYSGFFGGDVHVNGNLSKGGGSFKIDHPLDPANKYLYHSFVESPDMMNIYNGNVTTDERGDAMVQLPDWFETLNRDFRYQLTVIGQFAQAIVASEIVRGHFAIKTDKPNVKVSWQVTGIRQDPWANAHRIPVELLKPERERGFYLHPELYGAPVEKSVTWARHPEAMQRTKVNRLAPERNATRHK
jgi:hypothetical protein